MDKRQIELLSHDFGRNLKIPISLIGLSAWITAFCTPIILIWNTWDTTWRVGLTAIIIGVISNGLLSVLKKVTTELIEANLKKMKEESNTDIPKSRFQIRLEKLAKEKGYKLPIE